MASTSSIFEEIQRIQNVPGFIYLIRNKDLYKIGITISMERRLKELKPDEVIAVKEAANMRGIEKVLHKRYRHQRVPQTEYFRLTPSEAEEAAFLLGAEVNPGYIPSEEARRESTICDETGSRRQRFALTPYIREHLDTLEDLLVNQLGFDALFTQSTDSYTGAKGNVIEIIYQTDNNDPDIKVPVSQDLREACLRVMNREDIFLPIVQADNELEAAREVERIITDFSLIYLWGSEQGTFNIIHADGSSDRDYQSLLMEMKRICLRKNVWYTRRPPLNPYWILVMAFAVVAIITPAVGLPVLAVLGIFSKYLRNRMT
jgi:hypothetical protein